MSLPPAGALLAILMCSAVSFPAALARDQPPAVSHDGLKLASSKNVALLYIREGATLAGYRKVILDPVHVAFDKDWSKDRRDIDADDRERILNGLAEEFREVFTEELERSGDYEVVTDAAPDVLRVTAAIVDLYVTAPDVARPGRTYTYTVSSGRMTLIAELRDSETRAILARVADRKEASNHVNFQWSNRATNTADARRILRSWAGALRKGLDSARGT
ncbi:MAG TPA: DUF3313 family protein [Steroidobacter sp.]|uniref:DUF3313 family protein n=1 Tax=Steroidobacter sp. TaxID=1978227 RepID=UPI002ED98C0E